MRYCIWQGILENDTVSGFNLKVHSHPNLSKASFMKRKVVKGKRVTLPAKSTLARVYVRKKVTLLPSRELTMALVVFML